MTQPSFKIFSPDGRFARVLRVADEDWTVVCWVPPPARGPRYMYERSKLGDRLVVELTGEERDGDPVARLVGHEALDGSWALPCAFSTITLRRSALGSTWVRCDVWRRFPELTAGQCPPEVEAAVLAHMDQALAAELKPIGEYIELTIGFAPSLPSGKTDPDADGTK